MQTFDIRGTQALSALEARTISGGQEGVTVTVSTGPDAITNVASVVAPVTTAAVVAIIDGMLTAAIQL